jgi:hypothetical protein
MFVINQDVDPRKPSVSVYVMKPETIPAARHRRGLRCRRYKSDAFYRGSNGFETHTVSAESYINIRRGGGALGDCVLRLGVKIGCAMSRWNCEYRWPCSDLYWCIVCGITALFFCYRRLTRLIRLKKNQQLTSLSFALPFSASSPQ